MKNESNNEIDLILRRLGRAVGRVPDNSGNGNSDATEAHLDADELNAYAENALPPATRIRYTAHLADCASCRQIVSQLSQAAGLVIHEETGESRTNGFKAFLASLFSPIVLRYAVPALGLLLVASIGFFVFRQSGSRHLAETSELQRTAANQTPTASPYDIVRGSRPVDSLAKAQPESTAKQTSERNEQAKLADDLRRQEKEEQPHEQVSPTDQVAAAAPGNAPPSTAGAAAPKPTVVEDQKQAEAVAQTKAQPTPQTERYETFRDEPVSRRAAKEPSRTTVAGLSAASPGIKKAKTDSAAASADENEAKRERGRSDKDDAEITSVAGHRFRKSGSVWIDVTYNSSQETTTVPRGSEQYRALIADEPGIRTIAEQLQGEVILVWKGRAYRIR